MRYKRSKWRNWRIIHSNKALVQPQTRVYSYRFLSRFLQRYRTVFVKPDNSFGGKNVLRIRRLKGQIEVLDRKCYYFRRLEQVHRWINHKRRGRIWIIQQAIELMPLRGRPVDIRTILQLNERKQWEVTAIFAKAARKGAAVTNVKAGGSAIRVDRYLKWNGFRAPQRRSLVKRFKRDSVCIARELKRHFPNRLYALDLGMDRRRKIWLIEINTKPSIQILRRIDVRMFRRTMQLNRRNSR